MGPLSLSPVSEDRLQISNVLSRLANTHTYTQTKITVLHINTHTISAVSLRCPLPVLRCCFVTNFRCKAALNLLVQKKKKISTKITGFYSDHSNSPTALARVRVWMRNRGFFFPFFCVILCWVCVCIFGRALEWMFEMFKQFNAAALGSVFVWLCFLFTVCVCVCVHVCAYLSLLALVPSTRVGRQAHIFMCILCCPTCGPLCQRNLLSEKIYIYVWEVRELHQCVNIFNDNHVSK